MKILLAILTLALLAACAPTLPSPTPQDTPTAAATDAPTATSTATGALTCTVTAYALNVRQCPGVECGAVSWLTRGEIVTIHDQRGAWYDIGAGWIHSKYCEVKP